MRVVIGHPVHLSYQYQSAFGEASELPAGAVVSVEVTDGAGAALTVGAPVEVEDTPGAFTAELRARDVVDLLTVTWTVTGPPGGVILSRVSGHVRVVGSRILSSAEMLTISELSGLGADRLLDILDIIEDTFGDVCGPVVPEALRVNADSEGGPRVSVGVPQLLDVVSLSVGGTTFVPGDVRVRYGWLERADNGTWPRGLVVGHLVYGRDQAPADLKRAAKTFAIYLSREPDEKVPSRATRYISEGGDFTLAQAGAEAPTGIPDVDEVLMRHRVASPV